MCGFVSTTREMLSRFVVTHLPVQYDAGPNSSAPSLKIEIWLIWHHYGTLRMGAVHPCRHSPILADSLVVVPLEV